MFYGLCSYASCVPLACGKILEREAPPRGGQRPTLEIQRYYRLQLRFGDI